MMNDRITRKRFIENTAMATFGFTIPPGVVIGGLTYETSHEKLKVTETKRNTYRLTWQKGEIEVNLIPANGLLSTTIYAGKSNNLITLHDNVGITGFQLHGCPINPRILWDNREHHFWQNFNGGFRPRNTVVNDIKIVPSANGAAVSISFYYITDYVKTMILWSFKESKDNSIVSWDTFFSFKNLSDVPMKNYTSFFACYHQPGKNYFWNKNNEIEECADNFDGFSDEEKMKREEEILSEFMEQFKDWTAGIKNPYRTRGIYGKPILLSEPREWYEGRQHILMVEPSKCLKITSAMRQARDYMFAPVEKDFNPGAIFTARVRHVITRINNMNDLKNQWDCFLDDIEKDSDGC